MRNAKVFLLSIVGTFLVLAFAPLLAAADEPSGKEIYQRLLRATTLVLSRKGEGTVQGTGWIVDRTNKLMVTNQHVVGDNSTVQVVFPAYQDGKLIAERSYYRTKARPVQGKVIVRDVKRDLAIVELESLPGDAQELKMAADSPEPTDRVHSVGNPGASDALWVYTSGTVRQVYHKKWKSKEGSTVLDREARVVETQAPINPGDSGGPVVNDKGEVVAVTAAVRQDARLVSICIDAGEIKPLLVAAQKRVSGGYALRDDGKFFTPETVQKVNDEVRAIARKYGVDVLIETVPSVPADKVDDVMKMSAAEREQFFENWVRERGNQARLKGIYILICRKPGHLQVATAKAIEFTFTVQARDKVRDILLEAFRQKRYDEGILNALQVIRDQLGDRQP